MNTSIDIANSVVGALSQFLGEGVFPLHEPSFDENEEENVLNCLRTGWVSSVGKYVDQFERELESFTGAKRAIVVMNGTAALHMCYHAAGVRPGDEVLCPSLTFVATANAITYCGGLPHFVDIDEETLGVDPKKLRDYIQDNTHLEQGLCINKKTGRPIRALVVTHVFGHPAKIEDLKGVCDEFGLELVEDAAESLGSFYKGVHTGNFGKASALSFNGNKIMTTGGGGAILTNDTSLGKKIKHLTTTAKKPHPWAFEHTEVGYNYRMPNINAALGCAQLRKMDIYLSQKKTLADAYHEVFSDIECIELMREPENCQSNHWLNAIILKERDQGTLKNILGCAHAKNIFLRPVWNPLHTLKPFKDVPKMNLETTEALAERILCLPSSPGIAK